MTDYYKYPKTWHLLHSRPDPKGNDRAHANYKHFVGREVVVSEKLDGENTTITFEKTHARSIDSGAHPSRTWIKALHASIKHEIPANFRLCGENMQAKHAIFYDRLPSYFFLFGVYNEINYCLSWDETKQYAEDLGLLMVPELYRGIWDLDKVHACYTGKSKYGKEQEGYVVRATSSFHYGDFSTNVSKFVRPGHVAGDTEHWSKTGYLPNVLLR